ncbi:hypothetical protein CHUAL_007592 [Chamberlinius hualienensis]
MAINTESQQEENKHSNNTNKANGLLYTIDDIPPWYLCLLLGLQQYLTMLSGAISIPYILAPAMCISENSSARAHLMSTIMFTSGIITILQTTIGVRLPIVQGGTFSFLIPILGMLNLPEWKCPNVLTNMNITTTDNATDENEIWHLRMQTIQGSIIVASLLEVFLGITGAIGALLHFITPLTITPTIALVGLSLFEEASKLASGQWGIAFGTVALLFLFSQYMESVTVPIPKFTRRDRFTWTRIPIFSLLPVLVTIASMWLLCAILTTTDVFSIGSSARTDRNIEIIEQSPWVRVPYPGQWGVPSVNLAAVIGLFAGVIASIIESIGDYYACARLSGASAPPAHAINRGIFIEGLGCIIAGAFGTGVGTTSYSENIGAIGITKVGSRRVILIAGILMMVMGMFTKFGAIFVSIPSPIVGGIFYVMFGMITAVGISNLQYVNLNSPRNLIVIGFSIFSGMAIPKWVNQHRDFIQTGSPVADQVIFVLLTTNMVVGGVLGCFLDNTIPGSPSERGLLKWREQTEISINDDGQRSYDIPYVNQYFKKWSKWTEVIPICPTFVKFKSCFKRKESKETNGESNENGRENLGFEDQITTQV